jgi:hypothetical protein
MPLLLSLQNQRKASGMLKKQKRLLQIGTSRIMKRARGKWKKR